MARKKINIGNTLSDSELRAFREMAEEFRRQPKNTLIDQPSFLEGVPPYATELHVARTPPAGIAALREDSTPGTGIEDLPGSALCRIFRIIKENSRWVVKPYTTDTNPGFIKRVFNFCDNSIRGNKWIKVGREKGGAWLCLETCKDTEATITGTGTGTGTDSVSDECDDIFLYETDLLCEGGALNAYRRKAYLNIDGRGCLTKTYDSWEFWHRAGSCGAITININNINNFFSYIENVFYFNTYNNTLNINIDNVWYVFCLCDDGGVITGTGTAGIKLPTGTGTNLSPTGTDVDPTDVLCLRLSSSSIVNGDCDCSLLNNDFDLINELDFSTLKQWASAAFEFCNSGGWKWIIQWTASGGILELQDSSGTVHGRWVNAAWNGVSGDSFTYTPTGTLIGTCVWPTTMNVYVGSCASNTGTGTGNPPLDEECLETACCDTTPPTWTVVTTSLIDSGYDNLTWQMVYNPTTQKWHSIGLPGVIGYSFNVRCNAGVWEVVDWVGTGSLNQPTLVGTACDPANFVLVFTTSYIPDPSIVVDITMFGECVNAGTGTGTGITCNGIPRAWSLGGTAQGVNATALTVPSVTAPAGSVVVVTLASFDAGCGAAVLFPATFGAESLIGNLGNGANTSGTYAGVNGCWRITRYAVSVDADATASVTIDFDGASLDWAAMVVEVFEGYPGLNDENASGSGEVTQPTTDGWPANSGTCQAFTTAVMMSRTSGPAAGVWVNVDDSVTVSTGIHMLTVGHKIDSIVTELEYTAAKTGTTNEVWIASISDLG